MLIALWLLLTAQESALERLTALPVIELQSPLPHVQGIAVEGNRLWVSSVERKTRKGYLTLFALPGGRRLAEVEVQEGERFHPGGITLDGDSIWVPVAEYRPRSSAVLQQRDKRTLALRRSWAVADHIGCVAVLGGRLIGGNWDSRQLYTWTRDGREEAKRDNPAGTRYQDLKADRGKLIGGGQREKGVGAIDVLDPQTLALERRVTTGLTDRGVVYTNEGLAVYKDLLYLLPEDGHSRLFRYRWPR